MNWFAFLYQVPVSWRLVKRKDDREEGHIFVLQAAALREQYVIIGSGEPYDRKRRILGQPF